MDRVNPLFMRHRDDAGHVQIRLNRPFSFAYQVGFVRLESMET